jgi:formyl-CoA transferase
VLWAIGSAQLSNCCPIEVIAPILEELFVKRSMQDWTDSLSKAGVSCGPIYTIDQVFEDPQVQARGMKIELPHAPAGKLAMLASPLKMSATPLEYKLPPPVLGEHNEDVLQPSFDRTASR